MQEVRIFVDDVGNLFAVDSNFVAHPIAIDIPESAYYGRAMIEVSDCLKGDCQGNGC